jgi:phage/plasmid-associated DNA primase
MLELKTKALLSKDAYVFASGHNLVRYRNTTYVPADFETRETSVTPDVDRTIWLPLSRQQIRLHAATEFNTLFASDGELSSFDFMVAQNAHQRDEDVTSLLVRTPAGLRELDGTGTLVPATGDFRPNYLMPMLNEDPATKDRVFATISQWLDSDVEAESLLAHLATSLAPGWSAVKYVLLLGEGRNGKSVLLKMLSALFGSDNLSHVTRQMIAEQSPAVLDLNGKLLNIVFDGMAEYLKDSGAEKSLIAGETFPIRRLYESSATPVQTNSLFIEGLQAEPKTKDKSTALQKRLVRFQFPNVYPLNHRFERHMLTEETLGAFLSLLVDRYVTEDEVAVRLTPTTKAIELQLEQMYSNSMGLQFPTSARSSLRCSTRRGAPSASTGHHARCGTSRRSRRRRPHSSRA